MATNTKKMLDINTDYVLNFCHQYCKDNNSTMSDIGEMLGHSACYIQSSCKNGKMPPAELELLSFKLGMDTQKALSVNEADASNITKWVLCSERLPKKDGQYIAISKDGGFLVVIYSQKEGFKWLTGKELSFPPEAWLENVPDFKEVK